MAAACPAPARVFPVYEHHPLALHAIPHEGAKGEMACAGKGRIRAMRFVLILCVGLAGCASWHWEKPGGDYDLDEKFCKLRAYDGADGMVTRANVRTMHSCMEAKGWRKVQN